MTWPRIGFAVAAWLYFVGIVIQVFFAGAGLFELTDWTVHVALGWGLGSAPVLLLVLAIAARVDRRTALLTAGLTVAAIIQPELAAARNEAPVLAALHPVNALLVFWLAWLVAGRATASVRQARDRAHQRTPMPTSGGPSTGGTA